MKRPQQTAAIVASIACLMAAGCTTMKSMGFLVPQGPGNAPDGVVQRTPPPAAQTTVAAAPVPSSRQFDVAPELVNAPIPAVRSDRAGRPLAAYTQATRYGDMIFISGQIPLDPGTNTLYDGATIEEQTRVVMENIRAILEGNRLTMANIVATTVYMKNVNDLRGMNLVYDSYFKGAPPARTVVEVSKLPRGVALQISAVAGR